MNRYDYLIIGGGMAGAAAAQGIREADPSGSIGLISAENERPYNRPPLTKKLWQGKPEEVLWRKLDLPQDNFEMILGCRVLALKPQEKQVQDEAGRSYGYGKLLLATGGAPRRLPFGPDEMLYFRTHADYRTLRGWTGQGARIGIIGGGFIGSELASVLTDAGEQAVMVFPEETIGSRIYPADLARYITAYYRQKGVELYPGQSIDAIEREGSRYVLRAKDGRSVTVDQVIAGIGLRLNIELAQAAGLTIAGPEAGGGVEVDEYMRTSQPDIYAAGDLASFYSPVQGRRLRVEHEDNALQMGRVAGLNMAGRPTPYHHQPYFYSDLFDLGYEAVGELDSRMETFADWKEPFREGVIYYLRDGRVRGVLLWNTWDQVPAARELLAEDKSYTKEELKGRLPKA